MWIELHDADGKQVLVRAEAIKMLAPSGGETFISFNGGSCMHARESYNEVKVMIYSGGKE